MADNSEGKWERVKDPDDPRRCQMIIPAQGQCTLIAVPGCDYCSPHGGFHQEQRNKAKTMRNYRLAKFHSRAAELGNSDQLSSLKDEVALLRMLIEEKLNACQDTHTLLLNSGPLSDLIMKCTVIVEKCHRLDSKLGNLLDRERVMVFAQSIIEIIAAHVKEEDLEIIGNKISSTLEKL